MRRFFLATGLSFLPASLSTAHEGHGHSGSGGTDSGVVNLVWHYLVEPQHAWPLVAVLTIGAVVVAYRRFASSQSRRIV